MRTAHLFAGAGGGMLADLILGHTPTIAVELDHDCCDILRTCDWWPELTVHESDVRDVDATDWQGRVDCVHAGIPCPRWSSARRGAGNPDNLWPEVFRIISAARPAFVFLECVPQFAREHDAVERDLAGIKYQITRPLVSDCAALGAPHARERYWAICYADNEGEPMRRLNAEMAVLPPTDAGDWWEVDPRNIRMADGVAGRSHRYRAIGNGQVPIQAAAAWLMLGGPVGQIPKTSNGETDG
jgi:DNA (cytosine-5)-methyltransferase 1